MEGAELSTDEHENEINSCLVDILLTLRFSPLHAVVLDDGGLPEQIIGHRRRGVLQHVDLLFHHQSLLLQNGDLVQEEGRIA